MYATCIFCHSSLGANEALQHFPVGKRLAFDAAKGRLWVVCPKCDRWNLSPLEERWEAIEEAERLYRDTKKRATTDNIGLARVANGTDLIRIGDPLRPEFAAWRYGAHFAKRRRKAIASAIAFGVIYSATNRLGTGALGVAFGGSLVLQSGVAVLAGVAHTGRLRGRLVDADNNIRTFSYSEAVTARYSLDNECNAVHVSISSNHRTAHYNFASRMFNNIRSQTRWAYANGQALELNGEVATRALANILPMVNMRGGGKSQVAEAVALVERRQSFPKLFQLSPGNATPEFWHSTSPKLPLAAIHPTLRLALEMSLHESDERRALEGELHELEQRWRDAEAIAAIADTLTLPENTNERIARLRSPRT